MRNSGLPLFFAVLLVAALILACGSPTRIVSACPSAPTVTNDNSPQSVSVCPAVADAKNYPGGLVQFAAIGEFTTGPSPALAPAIWGVCQDNGPTTGITVTTTGLAHCASGASGTYTVWATGGPDTCLIAQNCGACGPTSQAQLTCP